MSGTTQDYVVLNMSEENYLATLEYLGSGVPEIEYDEQEGYPAYIVVHPLPRYRRRDSKGGHQR